MERTKSHRLVNRLFLAFGATVGLIVLCGIGVGGWQFFRMFSAGKSGTAVVVDVRPDVYRADDCYPVVQFTPEGAQAAVRHRVLAPSLRCSAASEFIGDEVQISYDPEHPGSRTS